MTKAELIAKVAKKTNSSQALTGSVVDATLNEIRGLLGKGGSISFTGFGSFGVAKRAKRKGRNPQTGQEMVIPASKVARFRPGKGLKEAVGGKKR
ncbi:MAG: HU family DNA-binding protein [Candidatus Lambdaproteobacteria bacterium]|nr:HU family DNA-binding protein [Candidatus Lambdaproteobacteria bacterium]